MKKCSVCKIEKPKTEFYKGSKYRDGLQYTCKECQQKRWAKYYGCERESLIEARQEYRRNTGELRRKRYGVSKEMFEKMLVDQGGKCACCQDPLSDKPHLDHCHDSNIVRGVLCVRCNMGIGYFGDSINRLQNAIVYLQKFSGSQK